MSHPALKNNFSCLIDGGSLTESGGLPSDSELTSPSGPLRRRRRNPILADGAASDEEPAVGMSDGSSANLMEEPALQRTVSFDDVASLQATPGAPTGLSPAAARLGGRASLDGEVAMDSPTLRMLPSAVLPFREEANGAQTMSARQAPKRTQSELGPETTSAPVTARDPLLFPGQRGPMTPINEISPSMGTPFGGPPPTVAAVATVRRDARAVALPALNAAASVPEEQKWTDFLAAELLPGPSYPTTDVVWGQTERDRVYNALLAVPFQLERLVWLGIALCLDSFLSIFAFLPLRVAGAVATAGLSVLQSGRSGGGARLRGDQLFDMLCAGMFLAVVVFLWHLKAGVIYFWVKELTQEFLKLSVLHTALELGDKICCSFGVDVLEALAASCTAFASQPEWSFSHALDVASDAAVALTLMLAHGAVIMAQALVFGVAMNSQKNTLLALLIASNFTEIKGTVLKRFDPTKLMVLATQDIVERFHLFVVLFFVLVEEAVGTGSPTFSTRLMWQCGYVLLAEVVIDVTKHAVLGKFNDIRPGVYREFMKDLCERVTSAQSHSMHKLVGFHPFASAALFLRAALSYAALRWGSGGTTVEAGRLQSGLAGAKWTALGLVAWIALSAFTALLGFVVKRGAVSYLRVYEARRGRMRGAQARTKPAALPGASPKASGGVQPPSPKSKDA